MINISEYDKESDSVYEVSFEDMNFHKLKWLDCLDPTEDDLNKIKSITEISGNDLERCIDEDERPGINDDHDFSIIIFKSPFKEKKVIYASSFAILLSPNLIITIRKQDVEAIKNIIDSDNNTKKKYLSKGSSYMVYQIFEKVIDQYYNILNDLEKEIDSIENAVFHNPDKKTVKDLFSLKKTLIYFHKALSTNREVISSISNEFIKDMDTSYIKNFRYVYEDTIQLIDMVATYRDILTSSLDIYLSTVSNNLSLIMKRMTAFGSLILVPTLITGIYGMNFRFMPELTWKYGYLFAWGLIIIWIIILVIYFKRKDWF